MLVYDNDNLTFRMVRVDNAVYVLRWYGFGMDLYGQRIRRRARVSHRHTPTTADPRAGARVYVFPVLSGRMLSCQECVPVDVGQ